MSGNVPKAATARARPVRKARTWLPLALSLAVGVPVGTVGAAYNLLGARAPVAQSPAEPGAKPVEASRLQAEARTGPMSHKVMLALVRTTLGALGNAIETGNYAVLRDLGAPGFGAANTAERLAEIFADQRRAKVDLSGVMITEPVVTIEPRIEATGLMRVAGYFPAGRSRYEFDLLYKPVEGRWRLFGISTGVAASEQVAQVSPPR